MWNSIAICGSVPYIFKKENDHSKCTGVPPSGNSPSRRIFLQIDATIAKVTPKKLETVCVTKTYYSAAPFLRKAQNEPLQGPPWSNCWLFSGNVGCGVWGVVWFFLASSSTVEFTTPKDRGKQILQPICNTMDISIETMSLSTNTICPNWLVVVLSCTIPLCIGWTVRCTWLLYKISYVCTLTKNTHEVIYCHSRDGFLNHFKRPN